MACTCRNIARKGCNMPTKDACRTRAHSRNARPCFRARIGIKLQPLWPKVLNFKFQSVLNCSAYGCGFGARNCCGIRGCPQIANKTPSRCIEIMGNWVKQNENKRRATWAETPGPLRSRTASLDQQIPKKKGPTTCAHSHHRQTATWTTEEYWERENLWQRKVEATASGGGAAQRVCQRHHSLPQSLEVKPHIPHLSGTSLFCKAIEARMGYCLRASA